MSTKPGSGYSGLLFNMVCDVCRVEGFDIESKSDSGRNNDAGASIIASRPNGHKTQRVAIECWEKDSQVDGKQIENFVQRLKNLAVQSGIYVSPKGFTADGEYTARRLGVELWDLSRLKQHLSRIETAERTRVPGTLPVIQDLPGTIFSKELENGHILRMRSLPRLEFRPYYFARFESVGKKNNGRGVVVVDGVDGRVCDASMLEGQLKGLPSTGFFIDCLHVEPSEGQMPNLPDELGVSNSVTVAPSGIAEDQVRALVETNLRRDSGLEPEEVKVADVGLLHVPIVTVELVSGRRSYRKVVQAATGKVIWDETAKCVFCGNLSKGLCEVCGDTVCPEHVRYCRSCNSHLCKNCVETKGVLSKQPFCPTCKNK